MMQRSSGVSCAKYVTPSGGAGTTGGVLLPQGNSQEIAHGDVTTKPDGSFNVKFTAKPDNSVSAADEPTFRYTIYADVTDTTGETRRIKVA